VTTRGNTAAGLSAADLLRRVVRDFADALDVLAPAPAGANRSHGPDWETGVILEITAIEARPSRPGEDLRVELTCVQRGLVPTYQFVLWMSVPAGEPIPYTVGQQCLVTLRPLR
jgi:hypothetical protein